MPPSNAQYIFTMSKVTRFYPPDREVLKDITLSFYPGAKIGVLGGNGAGKSSLLRIMAGLDDGFTGEARLTKGFTVGLLEQEPKLDESKDVHGNVMDGVGEAAGLLSRYDEVLAKWSDPDADYEKLGAQQAELETEIEAAGAWDLQRTIEVAMDALRLPPADADVSTLSGGERRRVALCRLLLAKPDLLLLDEPTNHLDAESVAWLERTLKDYPGTVVAVTHDRYFLDNVAGWILELDHGRGMPFEGNYSSWLEQKQARIEAEEKQDSSRKRTLERELEWVRMAPKARQAKGKARLAAYDKLLAEAKEAEGRDAKLQITIPAGDRLGDVVIEAEDISKGFGDRLLIDDLTFTLPPAGIVGVIGANGAGQDHPLPDDRGRRDPRRGRAARSARPCSWPTSTSPATPSTPSTRCTRRSPTATTRWRSAAASSTAGPTWRSLNFKGPDQQKKVGDLSGGERNRVHLAKVLKRGGNVLLLDEPTNDLDVDTLRALEDALEAFAGCAVIISHDRWFLDRVATHVLAFEGDSQVRWFEGNFSEYEAFRRKELGAEADQPHRIKYKPLVRS